MLCTEFSTQYTVLFQIFLISLQKKLQYVIRISCLESKKQFAWDSPWSSRLCKDFMFEKTLSLEVRCAILRQF